MGLMIELIRLSLHKLTSALTHFNLRGFVVICLLGTFGTTSSIANETKSSNPLVIGIYDGLWPCAEKDATGYKGLTIDIWNKIANRHSLDYIIKPLPSIDGLVNAAEKNEVDLVISCHVITPERASRVDFSVPFSYSSIAILSKKKEAASLQFAARVLTNGRVIKSFILLLLVTLIAALALKRQVSDDSSVGRIWSILILGSGVHSFLSNKKRTHFPVLTVTGLRLILVSILVGTTASVVFEEDKPRDASKISRNQLSTLISEGLGIVSRTSTEPWAQKKLNELRIPGNYSDIKLFPREEAMIDSLKSGEIDHVVAYNIRFPYYMHLLGNTKDYHASFVINSQTPIAFIFSAKLSQSLRRLINSELAALNHDGTISNIEKYWISSLD